jgi:hypothetical protein
MKQSRKNGGWITMEVVTALSVLVVIMACLSLAAETFGKFNAVQLRKQQCQSAAYAQLDSIVVTGEEIDKADLERLWEGIEVTVDEEAGEGIWEGLRLVKVTASGTAKKRRVEVELRRYLAANGER